MSLHEMEKSTIPFLNKQTLRMKNLMSILTTSKNQFHFFGKCVSIYIIRENILY